ncbi:MAG: hypothetical protein R2728_03620 [Chitinophagales bacterium]
MLKTFTPNDLLLFYYKETDSEETLMIKNALVEDEELKEEYLEMRKLIGFLNSAPSLQPNQSSVNIVLEHSRKIKYN